MTTELRGEYEHTWKPTVDGLSEAEQVWRCTQCGLEMGPNYTVIKDNVTPDCPEALQQEVRRLRAEVQTLCDQRDEMEARIYRLTPPNAFDIGMQG